MDLSNNFYICLYILLLSIISFTLYKRNTKPLRRLTEESLKLLRGRDYRRRRDIYHYGSLYGNIKEDYSKKKKKKKKSSKSSSRSSSRSSSSGPSTEYVQVNGRRARTGDRCPPLRRSECQENNGNRSNCLRSYSSGRNGNRFCQWKPGKNQCKTTGEICNVPPPPPPPPRVGCMIRGYDNYDSKANRQGNCIKIGCMTRGYDNYDSKANRQGNCIKKGCMTRGYDNYDSKANRQGNCIKIGLSLIHI